MRVKSDRQRLSELRAEISPNTYEKLLENSDIESIQKKVNEVLELISKTNSENELQQYSLFVKTVVKAELDRRIAYKEMLKSMKEMIT